MKTSIEKSIATELSNNSLFNEMFNKFEFPNLDGLSENLDLVYKSNEYMGYYKKDIFFDLHLKDKTSNCTGTMKLSFVSSVKSFDIEKATHSISSDEIHNVSVTFMLYNKGNDWDTARYNYTLWKNNI